MRVYHPDIITPLTGNCKYKEYFFTEILKIFSRRKTETDFPQNISDFFCFLLLKNPPVAVIFSPRRQVLLGTIFASGSLLSLLYVVSPRVTHLLSFFFARIMGNLGPCGRNFVRSSTVVHSLTKFLAKPDIASYFRQKSVQFGLALAGCRPCQGLRPRTPDGSCAVCGCSVCKRAGEVVQSAGVQFGLALAGGQAALGGVVPHTPLCSLRAFSLQAGRGSCAVCGRSGWNGSCGRASRPRTP